MKPALKKWLWFVGLWCMGVLALTLVGGLIRWALL